MKGNDMPTDALPPQAPEHPMYGPYTLDSAEEALRKTPGEELLYGG